jgi:hypothetical protein
VRAPETKSGMSPLSLSFSRNWSGVRLKAFAGNFKPALKACERTYMGYLCFIARQAQSRGRKRPAGRYTRRSARLLRVAATTGLNRRRDTRYQVQLWCLAY